MEKSLALLLACLLVFTFLIAVDATSVMLAISAITTDLEGDVTESFWIAASYLLAMCTSQPIASGLSNVFGRRNTTLASILMLGIGSMICEDAQFMASLLAGRGLQGLGAGGLTVLSYVSFGDLDPQDGLRFMTATGMSMATGTVCGPLIGAALSGGGNWRWIFRLNIPACIVLGVLVYNTDSPASGTSSNAAKLSDLDFIAAVLSITSTVPLLVGLSLAGRLYKWKDWHTIVPIVVGSVSLIFFAGWELFFASHRRTKAVPYLRFNALHSRQATINLVGAFFLGVLMYALLFFLPIYYRVVKQHSDTTTALLLLPQTLMTIPCAGLVFLLVNKFRIPCRWIVLLGWVCTSGGIGLLSMLNSDKAMLSDVVLNLLSGFGIGILFLALTLSTRDNTDNENAPQASMVLIYMRYLGSASGLVTTGIVFQHVLRQELYTTKFKSEADKLTRHATTLMHAVREMPDSSDKGIFIQATQNTLRIIWVALSIASAAVFLFSCTVHYVGAGRAHLDQPRQPTRRSLALNTEIPSISKPGSVITSSSGCELKELEELDLGPPLFSKL